MLILLTGCIKKSSGVYWCGDHACKNKKEVKMYFEKYMIIEVRDIDGKKETLIDEQSYVKLLEENKKLKENNLKIKNREKIKTKIKKKSNLKKIKETKSNDIKEVKKIIQIDAKDFDEIINIVIKKNKNKPYPDINDIPG